MNERVKKLIEDRIAALQSEIYELQDALGLVDKPARAKKTYATVQATATANDEEPKSRRGQHTMSDAERKRVSRRMKKMWAMKKAGTWPSK